MKARLLKGLQGDYIPSQFSGQNEADIIPIGRKVLVLMDAAPTATGGGVIVPEDIVERMSLASESGVIIEMGGAAFTRHEDGSAWSGPKPLIGDRVYVEKYAGLLAQGADGKRYRIMDDGCIGGILVNGLPPAAA